MSLLDIDIAGLQENIAANFWMGTVRKSGIERPIILHVLKSLTEHHLNPKAPFPQSFLETLVMVEIQQRTLPSPSRKKSEPTICQEWQNLQAFVTNAVTKCLKVLISLHCFKIFRAQPIEKHDNRVNYCKDCNIASRCFNRDQAVNKLQTVRASTNINTREQNRLYTTTTTTTTITTTTTTTDEKMRR